MRNIFLATVIALGASAAFYVVATLCGLTADIAKGVAGLPAFAIKNIYEFLELRTAKLDMAERGSDTLVTLEEFSIRPLLVIAIGLVMVAGMLPLIGAVMGGLVGIGSAVADYALSQNKSLLFQLIIFTSVPLKIIGSVQVGRWIGGRSTRHWLLIAIGAVFLGSYAAFAASMIFIDDDLFQLMSDGKRTGQPMLTIALHNLPDIVIYAIACAIGAWSGRRKRFIRYLAFILRLLPRATRETIVDLARDEASKTARPFMQKAAMQRAG